MRVLNQNLSNLWHKTKPIVLRILLKAHLHTGKKILHEVLAMVKQLGIPTLFMTLSCVDLRSSHQKKSL